MAYIICISYGYLESVSYIGDGTFIYNHQKYATLVDYPSEAKKYSSRKRAENAYKKLYDSCCNLEGGDEISIIEIED